MDLSADRLLLSTKLKIPVPRKNYVVRRALFEKLSHCRDMSVIFVRGGAGTGKTTLLSSFLRESDLKNVCWLSVDASNANIYSFWLYFAAAVSPFRDDGDSFLSLMRSVPDAAHMKDLLIVLINRLCGAKDCYMVLDDVQCIRDEALIGTFEFFLGAMPSNFHLFLLSREDPPVYLGPLAVSGRLLFIDGGQMQLSREEGMAFLKNTLRLTVGDEELNRLNEYAEGWIGGLQLAAAAEAAGGCDGEFLRAGGGIAAEYLTREVFASLTRGEKEFLTNTGNLSYFDAEICAGMFGDFSKSNFDEMVGGLIGKNLFVVCVDEPNGVYRYHNILSEYLARQFGLLPKERRQELHVRAAKAFERKGDCEEALREFCAAENYGDVLRVARNMGGRIEAWSYLDQVPTELLISDVDLSAQCFLYNLGNLNMDRCRILFEKFRENYGDTDVFNVLKFAEAYFSRGDGVLPQYQALTAERIGRLPFGPMVKAMMLVENSEALLERMQYEEAESCIGEAIRTCTNVNVEFFALNQLAQVYEETGRLNDSLSCYLRSEELFRSPMLMNGMSANYYFGLTGVYMRRMELSKASETLGRAQSLLEEQNARADILDMSLSFHLAELKFLTGDVKAGAASVQEILTNFPFFSVLTLSRLIYELECAEMLSPELADRFLQELSNTKDYRFQPFMRLLRARILSERGDHAAALRETEEILTFSRLHKNSLRLVEAGLLRIFLLSRGEQRSEGGREVFNLLREAVHYASEDRILMPFYLDRETLFPLLSVLPSKSGGKDPMSASEAAFVREATALCGGRAIAPAEAETLSPRELEVLGELSLGITNREIAEKLCISQATVKTHVLSIFGKLGVSSRMMAVEQGRKKGLIR